MKQVQPCQLPDCPDGTDPCNPQANALKPESTSVKSETYAAAEGLNHMPATVWTTSSPTRVNVEESTSEALDSSPFMSTFPNEARTQSSLSVGQNNVISKQLFDNIKEGASTNDAQSETKSVEGEELADLEGLNRRPAVVWTTSPPTNLSLVETVSEAFKSTASISTIKNEARTESLLPTAQNKVIDKHHIKNENEATSTAQISESKGKTSVILLIA